MKPIRLPNSQQIATRTIRFSGPVEALLQNITNGGPLYVHAKNRLAELAAIVPLSCMVTDPADHMALFPEDGLSMSLKAVEAVHGVALDYSPTKALALEMGMNGDPRSLSIVAVPNISDHAHFAACFDHHPAKSLSETEYRRWVAAYQKCPQHCPCCEEAAHERRLHADHHPIAKILRYAITNQLELRIHLISTAMGFTVWLRPQELETKGGVLSLTSEEGKRMLEIDVGICHTLRVVCRKVDDEAFTEILLHDSLGTVHLSISVSGWDKEVIWRKFFA